MHIYINIPELIASTAIALYFIGATMVFRHLIKTGRI